MLDVLYDGEDFPRREGSHTDVVLGASARRQRVDGRRVTQHFVLRHCAPHHKRTPYTLSRTEFYIYIYNFPLGAARELAITYRDFGNLLF